MTAASSEPQPVVLYDDDCAFCKWSLDKILAWDRHRRLRPVAIQSDEGQGLLASIPESERLDSWHLVLPSGEVRSAGAAAAPLGDAPPAGGRWRSCFEPSRPHRSGLPLRRREPQSLRALARNRRQLRAPAVVAIRLKVDPCSALIGAGCSVGLASAIAAGALAVGVVAGASVVGGLALAETTAAAEIPSCLGKPATIVGTTENDVIRGTRHADVIVGRRGLDLIRARGGNDRICSGKNHDYIFDAGGDDRVRAGPGQEHLTAGPGDDRLDGDPGDLDSILYERSPRGVELDLRTGAASGFGSDRITGIELAGGSPYGDILRGTPGQNFLNGEAGADVIAGFGGLDVLIGEAGADQLEAGRGSQILFGDGGPDRLDGGRGNDEVEGDDGADRLNGGNGSDNLSGGRNDDMLDGGEGGEDGGGDTGYGGTHQPEIAASTSRSGMAASCDLWGREARREPMSPYVNRAALVGAQTAARIDS